MRNGEIRSRVFARKLRGELTKAELLLCTRLRQANRHGYHFRRQHPIGPYIADFACARARLAIEVDGAAHGSESEQRHDARRDGYFRSHGWRVLRISNLDIYDDVDRIVEFVLRELPPPSRDVRRAPPPPQAGEDE